MLAASVLLGTGTAATFAPRVGPLAIGAAAMGLGGPLQALTVVSIGSPPLATALAERVIDQHLYRRWTG